jgi:hypothetical protein
MSGCQDCDNCDIRDSCSFYSGIQEALSQGFKMQVRGCRRRVTNGKLAQQSSRLSTDRFIPRIKGVPVR